MKAEDSEGMEATLGAAGEEEAVTALLSPPNGRAVLLYAILGGFDGLVYVVLGAG